MPTVMTSYNVVSRRLLSDKICNLDVGHLHSLCGSSSEETLVPPRGCQREPYTSERLRQVPFGYQALTPAVKMLEIDFNNPQVC